MLNVCQNTSPQVCRTGASDNGPDGGAFANHFGPWMVTSVKKKRVYSVVLLERRAYGSLHKRFSWVYK